MYDRRCHVAHSTSTLMFDVIYDHRFQVARQYHNINVLLLICDILPSVTKYPNGIIRTTYALLLIFGV